MTAPVLYESNSTPGRVVTLGGSANTARALGLRAGAGLGASLSGAATLSANLSTSSSDHDAGPVEDQGGVVRLSHTLSGESFEFEIGKGWVCLRHPNWSLLGEGHSLLEAELDLRREAEELAEVLLAEPLNRLSYEALRLREFVLRY